MLIRCIASWPGQNASPTLKPFGASVAQTTSRCELSSGDSSYYLTGAYIRQFNIPVPNGQVVTTAEEARDVVSDIGEAPLL